MALSLEQRKSLKVGIGLLLAASLFILIIWWGTYLPGFAGEVFSVIAGILWTPVLLDISLFVVGLSLVLWLNKVRLDRDGDEYVYLEQVDSPDAPDDLPEQARSAIYESEPADRDEHPELAAIEGAIEMGDYAEATELLLGLSEDELELPDVLALRCELARRQGRKEDAATLADTLRVRQPDHPALRTPPGQDEVSRRSGDSSERR